MEIPSIQLSLEHIEELDFTCPAAKKSINIGKEIIPVKFVVNIYPCLLYTSPSPRDRG